MATPVAHGLAGLSVYFIVIHGRTPVQFREWQVLIILLLAACLPDLDFLPDLLSANPERWHREFSHSVAFGLIVALPFLLYQRRINPAFSTRYSLAFLLAALTHLAIDWLSLDVSEPSGIELLWPFSPARFMSESPLFLGARRNDILSEFTLQYNMFAVFWESLVLIPVACLCRYLSDRHLSPLRE